MIEAIGITQHYGVRPILRDVNLRVETGELVAIMGPNGTGKTTLLKVLAGVLSPQSGYVVVDGLRRRSSPATELAIRKRTVFLPAEPWVARTSTGREFLLAVGRLWEIGDERLLDHVEHVLDLFRLSHKADAAIGSYSTGERKKIALAGALVTDAKVMILDEPFAGGLDPAGIAALTRVLRSFAVRGERTIVIATPVPELVEGLAHRVAIVGDGSVLAFDTPARLRELVRAGASLQEAIERWSAGDSDDAVERYLDFEGTCGAG
ncbi:MAG: ABC transporter ATP-binding protein [bacterium]